MAETFLKVMRHTKYTRTASELPKTTNNLQSTEKDIKHFPQKTNLKKAKSSPHPQWIWGK